MKNKYKHIFVIMILLTLINLAILIINWQYHTFPTHPQCEDISSLYYRKEQDRALNASNGKYDALPYRQFQQVFQEIHDLCQIDITNSNTFYSYPFRSKLLKEMKDENRIQILPHTK